MTDLTINTAIQGHSGPSVSPAAAYLATQAPSSRPGQASALRRMAALLGHDDAETCPWHELRAQHTHALRQRLIELEPKFAGATINRHLAALRGVLLASWRMGLMSDEDRARAADVKTVTAHADPAGRMIEVEEIQRMISACASGPSPGPSPGVAMRDRVILMLLSGCGIRRQELASMTWSDAHAGDGRDERGDTSRVIRVMGKGRKIRTVPVPVWTVAAMLSYEGMLGGVEPNLPYIRRADSYGKLTKKGVSAQMIYELVVTSAGRAKVSPIPTPHDFRRTWITNLIDAGVEIGRVSEMAGHTSINQTARYLRFSKKWGQQRAGFVAALPDPTPVDAVHPAPSTASKAGTK